MRAAPLTTIQSLSVIIPAYNEELALNSALDEIVAVVDELGIIFEIVVINDCSSDGSAELLKLRSSQDNRIRVITHEHNLGKGQALRTGFANASRYDWTLVIDADRQIPLTVLHSFASAIHQAEALIGNRFDKQYTLYRRGISFINRMLVKSIFGIHVSDVNCPFKLIKSARLQGLRLSANGFGIDAELLWKLSQNGTTTIELPVESYPRQTGVSKVTPRVLVKCLLELLSIRIHG
jgi:glycosyltransferase involved in cell wall biosynthesis